MRCTFWGGPQDGQQLEVTQEQLDASDRRVYVGQATFYEQDPEQPGRLVYQGDQG